MYLKTFLLLNLVFSLFLYAQERPKIGLVLSGGGARGGAHVGIIRFLEEKNIPIDAIAGTSMGAFVGGLYASGMSVDEIDTLLTKTQWNRYIAYEYDRDYIPIRRKLLEHDFASALKVGVNKDNEIVLGTGLFKRQEMVQFLQQKLRYISDNEDFDKLRIPYRAVASDLKTGESVVLKSGSLAQSIYASIAIPGGFEPIVINGKTLVDGGVASNLPLDVMREMDVDIIIAIDISTPFSHNPQFNNYIDVMGQLSNILMRRNVERSIASMKDNEILITPNLEGYTPLDADKYPEIISIGYSAAQQAYDEKLAALSVSKSDYEHYLQKVKRKVDIGVPIIDDITLDNQTYLNDKAILERINIKKGEPLDYAQLDEDIKSIFNLLVFDDVNYKIKHEDNKTILHITTTPKWDINGELKFSLGFEDNFDGHSDYSVKFEYIMFGLNGYGGEWRSRFEIGKEKLVLTEFYQPLDPMQTYYVRPSLFYADNKVYVSPSIIGGHQVASNLDDSIPVQAKDIGAGFGFGVNIQRAAQLEIGLEVKEVQNNLDLLTLSSSQLSYETLNSHQKIVMGYVNLKVDTLDKAFFPESGVFAEAEYIHQLPELGSENEYDQAYIELASVVSIEHHTLIAKAKYGTTLNAKNFDQTQDFNAYFTLGGLFNLSGLPSNALTGDNVAFGALTYRYKLNEDDFFGALSVPLYAGMSVEMGKAWYEESNLDIPQEKRLHAGSVYLGADTILGPFFLGLGAAEGGYYSVYLTLGQTF